MPVGASTIDYAGRQVDVELLQTITDPSGTQSMVVSNVASQPKIVAGVQKALQRYTVLLLTMLEDVHFAATSGSELMGSFNSGRIANNSVLQYIFVSANRDVLRTMAADDSNTAVFGATADDEKIASTYLSDYSVNYTTGVVSLTIQFTMVSGSVITYLIPVATAR